MIVKTEYELWQVTYENGGGEHRLLSFPTLDDAKHYAKGNLHINKTSWKRNSQGDLYSKPTDTCHFTIDEVLTD